MFKKQDIALFRSNKNEIGPICDPSGIPDVTDTSLERNFAKHVENEDQVGLVKPINITTLVFERSNLWQTLSKAFQKSV